MEKALVVLVVVVLLVGGLFLAGESILESVSSNLGLLVGLLVVAFLFWLPIVAMVTGAPSDY